MITLCLLHPVNQKPIEQWSFKDQSKVGIGRSTDSNIVLYNAVVSRRHVELRKNSHSWYIVNLGTNGTYFEGKRIEKMPVQDGMTIRLARSGPILR
ncbi:MAG: FHA domain-containing protein, partial [Cyanothece sp. SIO2G6]|nr:FHA domain-containing protein [Cyanothece sp. SIO2G6]